MSRRIDENELRELFSDIEAPPGLDRWRERLADVHAQELVEEDPDTTRDATVVRLPAGRELRPHRPRKRSVAVAAAAAVVVGLGGVVVTSQLLSEAPPADPTMIIDGPDRSSTSTPPETSRSTNPSGTMSTPPPNTNQTQPNQDGEQPRGGQSGDEDALPGDTGPTARIEPVWPVMVGDPSASNTGVPIGSTLSDHHGDLRITTAGQVVSDLRVTGSVIVDAPNVTLRRVHVVASFGVPAVRQNAANLTIENSELSGGLSLTQNASGLVVNRCRLEAGVTITTGAQLSDNFLNTADVLIPSGSTTVVLSHNVMGQVTMSDLDAPIRDVSIRSGVLTRVDAPTQPGSGRIHVLNNRFRATAPSTGWNSAGDDYRWSGNTYVDSGAPANP